MELVGLQLIDCITGEVLADMGVQVNWSHQPGLSWKPTWEQTLPLRLWRQEIHNRGNSQLCQLGQIYLMKLDTRHKWEQKVAAVRKMKECSTC